MVENNRQGFWAYETPCTVMNWMCWRETSLGLGNLLTFISNCRLFNRQENWPNTQKEKASPMKRSFHMLVWYPWKEVTSLGFCWPEKYIGARADIMKTSSWRGFSFVFSVEHGAIVACSDQRSLRINQFGFVVTACAFPLEQKPLGAVCE